MDETTLFGLDRDVIRSTGSIAMFALAVSLLFVQPWFEQQGLAVVGIVLQTPLAALVIWSLVEEFRFRRERRRTD